MPSSTPGAPPGRPGAVGLVDDPGEQRRLPLEWTPAAGNLLIVGAVGSGTTTTLRSVLLAACAAAPPAELHVVVIDARGDPRLDALGVLDHCAGVVRPHERERLSRLVRRLDAELDARRAVGSAGRPVVVLAIDGLPAQYRLFNGREDHAMAILHPRAVEALADVPPFGFSCEGRRFVAILPAYRDATTALAQLDAACDLLDLMPEQVWRAGEQWAANQQQS